jgi:ribonuclease-3
LASALDYHFSDDGLLDQALTHRSAGAPNNERLEFLGDAVLGYFVAEVLYARFPLCDEGQLSRLRALLVKKESLAAVARCLNLGDYLTLGAGELRSGGHARDSILADAVEAIIAAVYLDGGVDQAKQMVHKLFDPLVAAINPSDALKDPKTRLQEFLQARQLALPEYVIVDVSGSQHAQSFRVSCSVAAMSKQVIASGGSRRKAEQKAAEKMLRLLSD